MTSTAIFLLLDGANVIAIGMLLFVTFSSFSGDYSTFDISIVS